MSKQNHAPEISTKKIFSYVVKFFAFFVILIAIYDLAKWYSSQRQQSNVALPLDSNDLPDVDIQPITAVIVGEHHVSTAAPMLSRPH